MSPLIQVAATEDLKVYRSNGDQPHLYNMFLIANGVRLLQIDQDQVCPVAFTYESTIHDAENSRWGVGGLLHDQLQAESTPMVLLQQRKQ